MMRESLINVQVIRHRQVRTHRHESEYQDHVSGILHLKGAIPIMLELDAMHSMTHSSKTDPNNLRRKHGYQALAF
jgi:hypothetical protein